MTEHNSRLEELRRRVQADPASIAFAQLAEEYRRAGANEDAVGICRAGLVHHPDYLSARLTLGRALHELGRLDESVAELTIVLATAPDNLAANRALAEVYQKRGQMSEALALYKRALDLAKFDPDLENEVQRIESAVAPATPPPVQSAAASAIEDLFDFDTLLEQLGGRTQPRPEFPPAATPLVATPSILEKVQLPADDADPLSHLEKQLRESEMQVRADSAPPAPTAEELHERRVLADLEEWLSAIVTDREQRLTA